MQPKQKQQDARLYIMTKRRYTHILLLRAHSLWPEKLECPDLLAMQEKFMSSSCPVRKLSIDSLYTFGVTEHFCCAFEAAQSPGSLGLEKQRLHLNPCSITDLICGLEQVINAFTHCCLWIVCSTSCANLKILLSESIRYSECEFIKGRILYFDAMYL